LMAHIDKVLVLQEGLMQVFGDRDSVLAALSRPLQPGRPAVRVVKG
jgi:ABC-type protease/lipase transport system fused ATPase/permease subunit